MIRFTAAALTDLAGIDNATAVNWGAIQAERYLAFLEQVLYDLSIDPGKGKIVDQHPQYRTYLAKFSGRTASYGHRIFYKEIDDGIRVIRILHTAMNWPDHISGHERE